MPMPRSEVAPVMTAVRWADIVSPCSSDQVGNRVPGQGAQIDLGKAELGDLGERLVESQVPEADRRAALSAARRGVGMHMTAPHGRVDAAHPTSVDCQQATT